MVKRIKGIKRGSPRKTDRWDLFIRNVPPETGEALEKMWISTRAKQLIAGEKPVGWHRFLIQAWNYFITCGDRVEL